MKIEINELSDEHDCETCGGSWAHGFELTVDGKPEIQLAPFAYCFDGESFEDLDLVAATLNKYMGMSIPCDEGQGRVQLETLIQAIVEKGLESV